MEYWQVASHVVITIIAVVGLALRQEHRLTKIETDVTWIKATLGKQNENIGGTENPPGANREKE